MIMRCFQSIPCFGAASAALSLSAWSHEGLAVPSVRLDVVATYPHDTAAFTEGLLLDDGVLFESTGLNDSSTLREVDLQTGAVSRSIALASAEFGEGIALVDSTIWMLTWKSHLAHAFARDDFAALGDASYEGEGWGLAFDGQRLIMSNGSSTLQFRDPATFASMGSVDVTRDGTPVTQLNELESVGAVVFANVWMTDRIECIDPEAGVVLAEIDASGLLGDEEAAEADVLNGIAFEPNTGHLLVTGKYWPHVFALDPKDLPGTCNPALQVATMPAPAPTGVPGELADAGSHVGVTSTALQNETSGHAAGSGCTISARRAASSAWFMAPISALGLLRRRRLSLRAGLRRIPL